MSNYLGDCFYVLEYLGHINNGAYKIEDLLQMKKVDGVDGGTYNNAVAKHKRTNKEVALENLNKLVLTKSEHRYGIPSSLPGNIANKLNSITVNESASVGIPKADISFTACDYNDLEAFSIIDKVKTWRWHDRGAGYRVWLGYEIESDVPGAKTYDYDCIFEGYVLETAYSYEKGGVTVNLSLNCYIAAKASVPLERNLWNTSGTTYELFQRVSEYIGIDKEKQFVYFGDPKSSKDLKAKIKALLGYKDDDKEFTEEERAAAVGFYNSMVIPKIMAILTTKKNPTPIQIFNIMARDIGILLRWHITTRGYIFLGIPMNPKIVDQNWAKDDRKFAKDWKKRSNNKEDSYPPKKVFTYRPAFASPVKSGDYLSQESWAKASDFSAGYSDFYESISLGELERGTLPITQSSGVSTGDSIKSPDQSGNDQTKTGVDGTPTTGSGGNVYTTTGQGSNQETKKGGIFVKLDGYIDVTDAELAKMIAEAFTLGNVSITISGVIPDPLLSILDTFEFIGYAKHSGRYLVTAITYTFSTGSRPKMEIRGITPLTTEDLERRNSGSLASVFAAIGDTEAPANEGVKKSVLGGNDNGTGGIVETSATDIMKETDKEKQDQVDENKVIDLAKDTE